MRIPSLRPFVVLFAALQLSACAGAETTAPSTGDPSLLGTLFAAVDTDASGLGSLGTLRVTNTGGEEAFFTPCTTVFERKVGALWIRPSGADRVCIEVLYRVSPGGDFEAPLTLPQGAEPGTYRLAIEFSAYEPRRTTTVYTNAFEAQ